MDVMDWEVVGGDPAPGEPEQIRSMGQGLRSSAERAEDALYALGDLDARTAESGWQGRAADAYANAFSALPPEVRKLMDAFRGAGGALTIYADVVQELQARAEQALARAEVADTAAASGEAARTRAQGVLHAQQDAYAASRQQAAMTGREAGRLWAAQDPWAGVAADHADTLRRQANAAGTRVEDARRGVAEADRAIDRAEDDLRSARADIGAVAHDFAAAAAACRRAVDASLPEAWENPSLVERAIDAAGNAWRGAVDVHGWANDALNGLRGAVDSVDVDRLGGRMNDLSKDVRHALGAVDAALEGSLLQYGGLALLLGMGGPLARVLRVGDLAGHVLRAAARANREANVSPDDDDKNVLSFGRSGGDGPLTEHMFGSDKQLQELRDRFRTLVGEEGGSRLGVNLGLFMVGSSGAASRWSTGGSGSTTQGPGAGTYDWYARGLGVEGEAHAGVQIGTDGLVANVGAEGSAYLAEVGANISYEWGVAVTHHWYARGPGVKGEAHAGAQIGTDGLVANVGAEGSAHLAEVGVNSSYEWGVAEGKVGATAMVGASADVSADAGISSDGAHLKAGAGAFVGGKAEANASLEVAGVTGEAEASARYGWGAEAEGAATLGYDKIGVSYELGLTVGVGGSVGVDVSVSPREVVDRATDLAGEVGDRATDLAGEVGDGATALAGEADERLRDAPGIGRLWPG